MLTLRERLLKAAICVYLAAEESVAGDLSSLMREAAAALDEHESARARVFASFHHQDENGKCLCVYCTKDVDGMSELAANYELDRFHIEGKLAAMTAENQRLLAGKFTKEEIHAICHNLHGTVSAEEFAAGCAEEQRKLYGRAPDLDRLAALEEAWLKLKSLTKQYPASWNEQYRALANIIHSMGRDHFPVEKT